MKQLIAFIIFLLSSSMVVQAQTPSPTSQSFKENSIGFGIGIPYGVIGLNGDINLVPNFNLTAGIGDAVVDIGYSFGFKYFFADVDKWFRPRIVAVYGTNSVLQVTNASGYDKVYTGLSVGLGAQYMLNRTSGIDLDIMFVATSGLNVDDLKKQGIIADEPSKVRISVGYRYAF